MLRHWSQFVPNNFMSTDIRGQEALLHHHHHHHHHHRVTAISIVLNVTLWCCCFVVVCLFVCCCFLLFFVYFFAVVFVFVFCFVLFFFVASVVNINVKLSSVRRFPCVKMCSQAVGMSGGRGWETDRQRMGEVDEPLVGPTCQRHEINNFKLKIVPSWKALFFHWNRKQFPVLYFKFWAHQSVT